MTKVGFGLDCVQKVRCEGRASIFEAARPAGRQFIAAGAPSRIIPSSDLRGGSARSGRLAHLGELPANISLLPLPPKSPEQNPTENVWQYLRDNWLSNRVFASGRNIIDHCCDAWNKLIDQPWTIMSIGLRDWAYG
jgi:hypothetical protein